MLIALTVWAPWIGADASQTATLDGRVFDADGVGIEDVSVSLKSSRGTRSTRTGVGGAYRFTLLLPGDYVVTVDVGEEHAAAVTLEAGGRRRIDLNAAAPGAEVGEEIVVTGGPTQIHLYEIGLVSSLGEETSEELSFLGRNYQASIEALPGVVQSARSRVVANMQPSVNGGQWQENAGFVDGVDTSFSRRGGSSRMLLPGSALSEVRVESGGLGAEYGRVVAGVTSAVVKAGTNDFRGSLLYLPQNQKWRSAFDALDIPREDDLIHSYEAAVGGPLRRDRLWFFTSLAGIDTNEVDLPANGEPETVGLDNSPMLLKLNARVGTRHTLSILGIDSPIEKIQISQQSGDEFTPCKCSLDSELLSFSWSSMLRSNLLLEAKVARQENATEREALRLRQVDSAAPADWPVGNTFQYLDRSNGRRFNAIGQGAGLGFQTMPRDQANVALSLFTERHELDFGVDYQEIEMRSLNHLGQQFQGRGYSAALPGGFVTPEFKRVFESSPGTSTGSEIVSAFIQDRISAKNWTFTYGLRLDDQEQTNDIGEQAVSSTDIAPRLALTYDLGARTDVRGRLLLKAGAGRYYQAISQDIVSREFARLPNGLNIFDEFRWNSATQRYDIFLRRSEPALDTAIQEVDPYYKDEITFGAEWQPGAAWVLKGILVWWEMNDLFWTSDQFDAEGRVVRDVRNWDAGFRKYRGIRLEANRALRNGWALRMNYTWGEVEGNVFGSNSGRLDDDDLFEGSGGVVQGTGQTGATVIHRVGRGDSDRTHNLNLAAVKTFDIGRRHVALGAYFGFRSGERWGLLRNINVEHPVSGVRIRTTTYLEPRDANQLKDTWNLNLSASWELPITEKIRGRLGVEAVNVTDEQELIGVNITNGNPLPGITAYQAPREIRLQVGIRF